MWSSWVGLFGSEAANAGHQATVTTIHRKDHSVACKMLGSTPSLVVDLDMLLQDAVFDCPHRSHDAVKQVFRFWCDDDRYEMSKDIQEGRLF